MPFNIEEHQGEGLDTLDKSQSMPLIQIIQETSPIVKKSDPNYEERKIEGAEAGMLVFANAEIFEEIEVIPLHGQVTYVEWKDKKPVAHHPITIVNDDAYKGRGHDSSKPNAERLGDNIIEKTNHMFVKWRPKGEDTEWRHGIIPFKSTTLKIASRWGKDIAALKYPNGFVAPIFCSLWNIRGDSIDSNDFGSWYTFSIKLDRLLDLEADETLLTENQAERNNAIGDAAQMLQAQDQKELTDDNVVF